MRYSEMCLQTNGAVVFNLIHGELGEDGTLQQYLTHFSIPFTGSGETACRICTDKAETAEFIGVRHHVSDMCCCSGCDRTSAASL